MINGKKPWLAGLVACFIIMMIATPAFARFISLKDAGVTFWIFIIIGAVIVLLQLIPTEEKAVLHGIEPAPVEK